MRRQHHRRGHSAKQQRVPRDVGMPGQRAAASGGIPDTGDDDKRQSGAKKNDCRLRVHSGALIHVQSRAKRAL